MPEILQCRPTGLKDPEHPFWSWSITVGILILVGIFLYRNNVSFDANEIKTWVEVGAILLGLKGAHAIVKSRVRKESVEKAEEVIEEIKSGK